MRELNARWLVEMAEYISDNPQFIVNGFIRAGISEPLDGCEDVILVENSDSCSAQSTDEVLSSYSEEEIKFCACRYMCWCDLPNHLYTCTLQIY